MRKLLLALAFCLAASLASAQDAGIGTLRSVFVTLCDSGHSAATFCSAAFTNLGVAFTAVTPDQTRFLELGPYHQVQIQAQMTTAVVTGDLVIQCDTDSAFGSATTLLSWSIGTGTTVQQSGWYDIAVGGECSTAAGVYVRAGLANGNTTEDPRIGWIQLDLK